MKVFCNNPRYIVHPYCIRRLKCGFNLIVGDVVFDYRYCDEMDIYRRLIALRHSFKDQSELDKCLCVDPGSGESYPAFLCVPCGKCALCKERKKNQWSLRALCEAQDYDTYPMFITLTYNDTYRPDDKSLHKEDLQKFLKRYRRYLEYDYPDLKSSRIRYFAVGEYGSNTGREHYHLLLYGVPYLDDNFYIHLVKHLKLLEKAWSFGFVYQRVANSGAVSYVMKYMRKDCSTQGNRTPCFFLSSRKGGGLGRRWLEKESLNLLSSGSCEIEILDKWSGQIIKGFLPSYFANILYPPLSKFVKKDDLQFYFSYRFIWSEYEFLLTKLGCDFASHKKQAYFKIISFFDKILPSYEISTYECCRPILDMDKFLDYAKARIRDLSTQICRLETYLLDFISSCNLDFYFCRQKVKEKYILNVDTFVRSLPDIDLKSVNQSLENKKSLARIREIF